MSLGDHRRRFLYQKDNGRGILGGFTSLKPVVGTLEEPRNFPLYAPFYLCWDFTAMDVYCTSAIGGGCL